MAKPMTYCLLACVWIGVMVAYDLEGCVEESAGVVCGKDYCTECHKRNTALCVESRTMYCQCLPGHQPMYNGVCLPGCTEDSCTEPNHHCNSSTFKCECKLGYEVIDGACKKKCPGGCGAHGICNNGTCFCKDGYFGINCGVFPTCTGKGTECGDNGECENYKCTCNEGFQGEKCEVECNGHGTMYDSYECDCTNGYSGYLCEDPPVCAGPDDESCGDHKKCTDEYKCVCTDGYIGENCAVECNGHGELGEWSDECQCTDGYTGEKCEIAPVCAGPDDDWSCSEHGTCTDKYICECTDGYTGENCTVATGCSKDHWSCGEHGTCTDEYTCECADGYTGENCAVECNGHGELDKWSDECQCTDGYTGEKCKIAPECAGPDDDESCGEHGTCTDEYKCVCTDGYTGEKCEELARNGGDDSKYHAEACYIVIGCLGSVIIIALIVVFLWKIRGNGIAYKRFTGSDTSKQDVKSSTSDDVSPQKVVLSAEDSTVNVDIERQE